MAAPFDVRPARRQGPSAPRQLAGAAVRLPTAPGTATKGFRKPEEWQLDSCEYFDSNPEMKFLGWWVGNIASVIELFPAVELPDKSVVRIDALDPDAPETEVVDPVTGDVTKVRAVVYLADQVISPAARLRALAEWGRLTGVSSAQSELQRDLAMNLEIAGECELVGWAARPAVAGNTATGVKEVPASPETWEIRSLREVYSQNGDWFVRDEPGKDGKALTANDDHFRLYQRHPIWKGLADCNMRAVIEECRLLQVLNGQMFAEHASKSAAGAFTWPTGLTLQAVAPTQDRQPQPEGAPRDPQRKVMDDLVVALTNPGHDPLDVNSRVPFFIVGEKDNLTPDVLRRIDFSRSTGPELDTRIAARVERFAHGVNAPVEVVLGHRNTTFANAAQIDENEFDDFIQPRAVLWCDLLAEGFLRPQMAMPPAPATDSNGVLVPVPLGDLAGQPSDVDISRVFVWYDASAIIGTPNLSTIADAALDRFAVGRRGYRLMHRIPEDYAPDGDEELAMLALRRGLVSAEIVAPILGRLAPGFKPNAAPAPAAPGDPLDDEDDDDDGGLAIAASAARSQVRAYLARQRALAEIGAELLGLDAATLPALGMGAAPPGPPVVARRD